MIRRGTADDDDGLPVDITALILIDVATGWIAVYPKAAKSIEYTIEAMQHFAGPKDNIKKFYCDSASELIAVAIHCM